MDQMRTSRTIRRSEFEELMNTDKRINSWTKVGIFLLAISLPAFIYYAVADAISWIHHGSFGTYITNEAKPFIGVSMILFLVGLFVLKLGLRRSSNR